MQDFACQLDQPKFEIVHTPSGEVSIRNNLVGEVMHNPLGPWAESHALYIEPSRLRERLCSGDGAPLVIYDVGLGAAANAIAALSLAMSQRGRSRSLTIVSFENDLSLLRFVVEAGGKVPYAAPFTSVMRSLLANRIWTATDRSITWIIREGDFVDTVSQEEHTPDIVFYDPYSPAVNAGMWSVKAFRNLYARCRTDLTGTDLFTYSRATPVRSAMLIAGFYVGSGPAVGFKEETTTASTLPENVSHLLRARWLARWQRSHTRIPLASPELSENQVTAAILSHPQWDIPE